MNKSVRAFIDLQQRRLCLRLFISAALAGLISGCTSTTDSDEEPGTSIEHFLNSSNTTNSAPYTEAELPAIRDVLNKASYSLVQHSLANEPFNPFVISEYVPNVAVVTWPVLGNLPLILLAADGTTADQLQSEMSEFGSAENLLGFNYLLNGALENQPGNSFEHHIWWQAGSRYNDDFLPLYNALAKPEHHIENFNVANSDALVDSLVKSVSGDEGYAYLTDSDKTRVLTSSFLNHTASFANEGLTVEAFNGNFLHGYTVARNVSLLRLQGNIEQYENDVLQASRVTLHHSGIRLTSIQPKADQYADVLASIDEQLEQLSSVWTTVNSSLVLPTFDLRSSLDSEELAGWAGLNEAFSETEADLRNMDDRGGLYLQGNLYSHVNFSTEGISVKANSAQAVTFSSENESGFPTYNGIFTNITLPWPCPEELVPDLQERIFVIEDIQSGLVISVIRQMRMQGASESCFFQNSDLVTENDLLSGNFSIL